jgi:hypothetical protein
MRPNPMPDTVSSSGGDQHRTNDRTNEPRTNDGTHKRRQFDSTDRSQNTAHPPLDTLGMQDAALTNTGQGGGIDMQIGLRRVRELEQLE